jgi:hypothetical protein
MTRNQPDTRSVPETGAYRNSAPKPIQRARPPHACRPASTTVPQFNYSQIPNALIDVWMPLLPASEFIVLMCVARFTFGFHRDEVEMGMRLIAQRTGLHLQTVQPGRSGPPAARTGDVHAWRPGPDHLRH